jgi:hypothetical protein
LILITASSVRPSPSKSITIPVAIPLLHSVSSNVSNSSSLAAAPVAPRLLSVSTLSSSAASSSAAASPAAPAPVTPLHSVPTKMHGDGIPIRTVKEEDV